MSQELLPCPFCGNPPRLSQHSGDFPDRVVCSTCRFSVSPEQWSKRAPHDDCAAAMFEMVQKAGGALMQEATPSPQPEKDGERDSRAEFEAWVSASGRGHLLTRSNGGRGWYIDLDMTAWWAGWQGGWQAARSAPRAALTEADQRIIAAAKNLVKVKGRHHAEIAMKELERAVREGGGK